MILFRLSGEHEDLPRDEVRALYETYGASFDSERSSQLLLVREDLDPAVLMRLALTHEFYSVEKVTDIKNIDKVLLELDLKKGQSFCVRCTGFPDNSKEERRAGELIFEHSKNPVSLDKPDSPIYLGKINDRITISFKQYVIGGFRERDPNDRPFFSPLALDPKLARLFLNLARLKTGDRVLDPFCGTGSVLIEAALMGLDAIGTDKDYKMVRGAKINLRHYGVDATVDSGDATDIKLKNLDAIVSDPPYARASKMFSESLGGLYSKFLKSSFSALKPGGYVVIAVPHDATLAYATHGFECVGDYQLYVHKSLTRRIYILRRPN